ncbi:MAG: thioredoxin family protein [Cyanobacteria bacterium P01_D01_bin.73]
MVLTPSTMLELGTAAPDFDLPDMASGDRITLKKFAGQPGLLVMFICQHCPYVKHVQDELAALGRDYGDRLGIVAISANDAEKYPDDGPAGLKEMVKTCGFQFPLCYDESQMVAQAYTAACTPDFFLFAADGDVFKLAYRGQLDDSRPGNDKPVTGRDLRAAMDALLRGAAIAASQAPSIGCNIKWKPGNEPSYFGAA